MNSIEFISDAYTEDGLAIIGSQVKSSKQKVEEWIKNNGELYGK